MVTHFRGKRSLRGGVGLAISSLGILMAPAAHAACTASGSTTTCSTSGENPWLSTVGTGRDDDGQTVVVDQGATIDVTGASAISLGDSANITVNGTVQNSSDSGMGNYGSGMNTIETNSNGTIIINKTGKVIANGTNVFDEAINVHGYGNTIINYGLIQGGPGAAVWFQDETTGARNVLDNYGTISRSVGAGSIIGTNAGSGIIFYNRSNAIVEGDLLFANGDDDLYFEPNSVVTGNVDGGGGVNHLTLQGEAGSADTLPGHLSNFATLTKQGEGRWTVSGSLEGFDLVNVKQGTLALTGDNVDYSGHVVIDQAGILEARAQSLPQQDSGTNENMVEDNGLLRFAQPDDGTYIGQIVGTGAVEKTGAGTLTLSPAPADGNTYSGGTTIKEGTIAIAADNALGAAEGGITFDGGRLQTTVDLSTVRAAQLAAGGGTLAPVAGTTLTYEGTITGEGSLTKAGAGTLVTTAANSYSGNTYVANGTLQAGAADTFSPNSVYVVGSNALLNLAGYDQTVAGIANAGLIQSGSSVPGTTLTTGSYVGRGGVLSINTVLGGDNSATDLLHVTGDTSGSSYLRVNNVGGKGAETVQGIRVIEVDGASNGQFNLLSDYTARTGRPAVIAGAYAYSLFKGTPGAADDGDWYLRSSQLAAGQDPGPGAAAQVSDKKLYQPGVPLYEVYGQALLAFTKMPTLQERVGNRYWVADKTSGGDAPAADLAQSDASAAPTVDGHGVWTRIEATHARIDPRSSDSDSDYTYDLWRFQGGVDGQLYEGAGGKLIGGLNVNYGKMTTDIRSFSGDGKIDVEGYGFGGTLTWYQQNGIYFDAQSQLTWFDSDLHSDTLGRDMTNGNNGFGYSMSLEAGKRIRLSDSWTITPQAQLPLSVVDFDSFKDPSGAKVERQQAASLNSRLGVSADYETSWKQPDGKTGKVHLYGISNVYYEMLDGVKVDVAGTSVSNDNERLWGGVGVGSSISWADGRYSLYAEAGVDTSLANFGDSYGVNGTLGLRYRW